MFARGQHAAWFYIVLVGWVKIFRTTAEGRESVVHVFTRGESFAEAAIFAGGDYPVSATAATAARLLAARLGMKPETLSRALAALREEGLEISGERIHVPDVGHLRTLANID